MAEENLDNEFDKFADKTDFLGPARIEMELDTPELTPVFPNSVPNAFQNDTYTTQKNTGGIAPNYPPSAVKENLVNTPDWGESLMKASAAKINSLEDKNEYAKMYTFDSSPKGAFKARYKAYGQDTYNKIGFSPLIDNESWYNNNTTFADDISRTMRTSALPMLGLGFLSPLNSYGNMLQGKSPFAQDADEAAEYDYYNQLSYSSKGGVGGFMNNLALSASYSMGILAEGAVEGALIGGAVGLASGAGIGALPGAIIGGAVGSLKSLYRLPGSILKGIKAMGSMAKNLKAYSDITKARQLFAATGRKTADFLNPVSNLTAQLKSTDNITGLARSARTVGALWHDVKNINMGIAEGRLEGGFTQNQTYEELYNEYYNMYGIAPDEAMQESMMNQAKAAGWRNSLNNSMLVFYSNKIAFPSITRAGFLKGLPKLGVGTVVGNVGKEFQIVFNPAKKASDAVFTAEKIGFRNALKGFTKPKVWANNSINYFKANLVEGFQESAQDILNDATKEYYKETFYNPAARNMRYTTGVLGDAFNKQISAQGAETFASGFLMGTILQLPGKIKGGLNYSYNRFYKNRANWEQHVQQRENDANDVVNSLNTMYKNAHHFFDPRISNYSTQMLAARMVDNSDEASEKELRDTSFTAFHEAVMTSLSNGTYDMFTENLSEYKNATPEELEEAWNLEKGQGRIALDNIDQQLDTAKTISKRFREARNKMKNQVDLSQFEVGSPEYEKARIYNEAYRVALSNLVFLQGSFDKNLESIKSLGDEVSSLDAIKDLNFSNFSNLIVPERLSQEIAMLETEIESLKSNPQREYQANIQSEIKRKEATLAALSQFQNGQNGLVEGYMQNQILKGVMSKLMAEDSSLSQEDVEIKAIQELMDQYDQGTSEPFSIYKDSFRDLLFALADTPEKKARLQAQLDEKGGIDTMFSKLLDLHVLNNETAGLTKFINLLSSPRDFYEHVDRNFTWMSELYDNKKEYVKDLVNQEISNIERNAILNELADKGVYVDLEQFANWVEDTNNLPDEFIDITNERVINKDSVLYEEYVDLFIAAAELESKKPAGEELGAKESLEARVEELNAERNGKINEQLESLDSKLKSNYGKTRQEILDEKTEFDKEFKEKINQKNSLEEEKKLIEKSREQLKTNKPLEIEAIFEYAVEQGYITEEQYNNAVNTIAQNQGEPLQRVLEARKNIDVSDIQDAEEAREVGTNQAFKKVIIDSILQDKIEDVDQAIEDIGDVQREQPIILENTPEYKDYEEIVAQINAKYDAAINEVKGKISKMDTEETVEEYYTTSTPFENFDEAARTKITELFDEYLVTDLNENPEIKQNDPEQYRKLRERWLERQSELINELNADVVETKRQRLEEMSKPPELKFLPFKADSKTKTEVLGNIYDKLQSILNDGEYAKDAKKPKEKTQLTEEDIQNINSDLQAIEGYIESRAKLFAPQTVAEAVVDRIEESIINRRGEVVEIYDDEGNTIGRKFANREDSDPSPERVTAVAEEIKQDLTGEPQFKYDPIEKTEDGQPGAIESVYNTYFQDPDISNEEAIDLFVARFREMAYREYKKVFANEGKLAAIENGIRQDPSFNNVEKLIKKYVFKHYSDAGTNSDALIRMFLTPKSEQDGSGFTDFTYNSEVEIKGNMIKVSDVMSEQAYNTLFNPASGIISKLRQGIIDGRWQILSENVLLFDENARENGLTGEIDLLAIDTEGKVKIIDIKTGNPGTWKIYGTGAQYDKEAYFRGQQSIYAGLFYNMSGIDVDSIGLLPLETVVNLDGYIESVKKPNLVPKGEDTIEIEKIEDIRKYGLERIAPNLKEIKRETERGETKVEVGIPQSDPTKLTLEENLGNMITYNGRTGVLSKMPNSSFGILVTSKVDDTLLNLTLESVQNELVLEKASEFKNEELISQLEEQVKDLEKKIKDKGEIKEMFPIKFDMENVFDSGLNIMELGIQPVAIIENVGQQRMIGGKVINAKFDNPQETIATINGVKYDVLRDASGNITVLSYMSNEQEIKDVDQEAGQVSMEIGKLRQEAAELEGVEKDFVLKKISKKQVYKRELDRKRQSLVDNNTKLFLRGRNNEDLIFALNKLPNSLQKVTEGRTKADEVIDLKEIGRLSLSQSISEAIDEIMSRNYPDAMDVLIDKGLTGAAGQSGQQIIDWATETIEELEDLGFSVINRGDLVDDISRQIDALNLLLGDLQLINLNKDGKISKRQKGKVRDYFEREEIQEGSSVPTDAESVQPEAKRVLRPSATKTELKRKIDSIRNKFDKEDKATLENIGTNEFIANLNEATKSNIENLYELALLEANNEASPLTVDDVKLAYEIRLEELEKNMDLASIEKGMILMDKLDTPNYYMVKKINKKSVTLENIQTQEKMNISEIDLTDYEKATDEQIPTVETTEEQVVSSEESAANLKELAKDEEKLSQAKENAKKSTREDRMNKLKDNSLKC